MNHRFDLLRSLQSAIKIPFCIVNRVNSIVLCIPDIQMPYLMNYAIKHFHEMNCDEDHPLIFIDDPSIFIAISQLSQNSYLILGPCGSQQHTTEFLNHFLFQKPYSKDNSAIRECLEISNPISLDGLKNSLYLAHFINTGEALLSENIIIEDILPEKSNTNSLMGLLNITEIDAASFAKPDALPHNLYATFAIDGIPMLDELFKRFSEPNQYTFMTMSQNHDRQTKYVFMVVANQLCQEAVKAGADADTVNTICETICQKIDTAPAYFDVRPYYVELISAISETVSNTEISLRNYSSTIANCISYINKHLLQKITLRMLANHCNLSERWLSKRFREEVGITLPDYINNKKLQRGAQLIKFTTTPIEEISFFLGFSNQSYFSKLFKEKYGESPLEYRRNHTPD